MKLGGDVGRCYITRLARGVIGGHFGSRFVWYSVSLMLETAHGQYGHKMAVVMYIYAPNKQYWRGVHWSSHKVGGLVWKFYGANYVQSFFFLWLHWYFVHVVKVKCRCFRHNFHVAQATVCRVMCCGYVFWGPSLVIASVKEKKVCLLGCKTTR